MVGLVIEDSRQGVRVQPRWRENARAALSLEKKSKPERHVISLRWVKGFNGTLRVSDCTTMLESHDYSGMHTPREAPMPRVFDVVRR